MASRQRAMLAYFLDTPHPGERFRDWPAHITILPTFWAKTNDIERLVREAIKSVGKLTPVEKTLGKLALFGRRGETPVRLIVEAASIIELHLALLDRFYGKLYGRQWCGARYCPHVSIRDTPLPEKFNFDHVALVIWSRNGKQKIIKRVFRL